MNQSKDKKYKNNNNNKILLNKISIFILFFILTTLSITNNGYTAYNFNESYDNLTLDQNGWCLYKEIPFKIYNSSDWNDKEEIKDNECVPGCIEDCDSLWDLDKECTECERRCREFNIITAEIKLYDGPTNSLINNKSLLIDSKLGINNTFKYTFDKEDMYLLEIFPEGNYNDFHVLLNGPESENKILMCPGVERPEDIKEKIQPKTYNNSFNYLNSEILLNLENTNIETATSISCEYVNVNNKLENEIKTFKINSENTTFSKLNIEIAIDEKENSEIKAFKLSTTNKWENIEFTTKENKIILEDIEFGTYSITQKEEEIEPIVDEITEEEPEEIIEAETSQSNNNINSNEESSIGKWLLYGFIIILIVGIIFAVLKGYFKPKPKAAPPKIEVLTTYNQAYNKTKEYVKKHKDKYLKDQIYRALKEAEIPKDIIDKVFLEEY